MMLDIKTLLLLNFIIGAVGAGVVAVIWSQNRGRFAGISFWLVGVTLLTAGATLIALRGLVPDLISMTLANTMCMAGLLIILIGLERFTGKKGWQIHNYVLLAVFIFVIAYFAAVQPNLMAREIAVSAMLMIYTFQCCWLLLRRVDPRMRRVTVLTGIVFAVYAASNFVRIILTIIFPAQSNDFYNAGAVSALVMTGYIVLNICLIISLILMVNNRLLADVKSQEDKFTTAFSASPYAITLTRPSDGRIFEVNEGFVNLSGYQYSEIIGKTIRDLNAWVYEEDRLAVISKLARGRDVRAVEYQFRHKTGRVLTGLFSANLITVNNETCILSSIGDITERKLAEEALRKSEERYRLLAENASDVIWTADMNLNTTYISSSIYAMQGHTPEEAMNLTPEQRYTPESLELISKRFIEVMANEEAGMEQPANIGNYEAEYIRKDGSTYWTETNASFIRDATGKAVGILGVTRDISLRKQAEEALRESEERHSTTLQAAMDGFWMTDLQGRLTQVNESYCRMSGYSTQELLTKHVSDLDMADDIAAQIQKVIVQGEDRFESRHRRKDGSIFDVEISMQYQTDGGGRVVGFLRDITERKQAEEALRESEEKYRLVVENAREAIFIAVDGMIKFANSRATELSGYSMEEFRSMPFIEFFHPDDRQMIAERYLRWLEGMDVPTTDTVRIILKQGDIRWAELSVVAITWEGKSATLGFLTDITDRKRLEEEQQRVAKLESVGLLAGGIAHDFNNILTSIMGNIGLARMEAASGKEIHNSLEQAEKASLRAKGLTQQLLTFSKGGTPVLKLASLTELLKDTAGFALSGSNVKCHFSIPAGLWHAEIDAGQVSQVIHNLVINAQQAMPAGGSIEIRAENMALSETQSLGRGLPVIAGDYIRIAVADHGTGIPKEHLDKIFDPFFSTKKKGSGLGLATSFSIARQHCGHLSVESEPGTGSTFYLYLPASLQKSAPEKDKQEQIKPVGKARILVMDDDQGIREIAGRMLNHIGYKDIEFAEDGAEAIKLYKAAIKAGNPFSVVILDLTIPGGMGGEDTVKKLLKIDSGVKAIVSSGYIDDSVIARYKECGFSGVVAKPYSIEQLRKAVQDVIGGA